MLLNDTIWLTISIIIVISLLLMIINRRTRDRCLKDFDGFFATMMDMTGKRLWGKLVVYSTGLEFKYRAEHIDDTGHIETSWILYKNEFATIRMIIRFHDELTEKNKIRRMKSLEKSFHPKFYRKWARGFRNLMVNLKDAFTDITSSVISAVSATSSTAKVLASQQTKISRVQGDLAGYAGTHYDPILEKHIGHQVVMEIVNQSNQIEEHPGVLREYSADFLEVMGIHYRDGDKIRDCDVVVPRSISIIRHSNEPVMTKTEKKRKVS